MLNLGRWWKKISTITAIISLQSYHNKENKQNTKNTLKISSHCLIYLDLYISISNVCVRRAWFSSYFSWTLYQGYKASVVYVTFSCKFLYPSVSGQWQGTMQKRREKWTQKCSDNSGLLNYRIPSQVIEERSSVHYSTKDLWLLLQVFFVFDCIVDEERWFILIDHQRNLLLSDYWCLVQ